MKDQESVSSIQMTFLFFAFITGSAIIYTPSPVISFARNGAWISLWLSFLIGLLLLLCILYLHHRHQGATLVENSRKTVGEFFTYFLCIPFSIYLFLMVSWITTGVGEFMTSTMMRDTPWYVFHSLILLTAASTVRAGIEVMARMFVVFTYILVFFSMIILVLSFNQFQLEFLLPILPDGIKPVLHGSYFAFGFPYAEVVVFSMVLSFTRKEDKHKLNKRMIVALFLNATILSVATICTIMIFGPMAPEVRYSLFGISRLIDLADFIQRIESVIGITLIGGSYMKATIALYALNYLLSQLFRLNDDRILIFPIATICLLLSLVMFDTQSEFIEKVNNVWPMVNLFVAVPPILLVTALTVYKSFKK